MTLIEVLIVMALVALIMGAVVIGSGQLASSRMRHSSTMIAARSASASRARRATSKSVRLVMDFTENAIWLEEGDQPMLVQSKDTTGPAARPPRPTRRSRRSRRASRIVKGPTRAAHVVQGDRRDGRRRVSTPGKGHKALERGIKFREVQTAHDDEPRKEGRAYLYFWPGGQTERAAIQLKVGELTDEKDAITLLVAPLTGKVTVKDGASRSRSRVDDKESSEREDPGAF